MTAADRNPDPVPDDGTSAAASGSSSGDEQWIAAQGPDVETSGTAEPVDGQWGAADQAFLDGAGGLPSVPEPESEHLADLRRLTAEYANYRRRVERERETIRERATGDAARAILPVLDDLDRAEAHGDLSEGGPLTAIAQKLRGAVSKLGLVPFAEQGELFDPHQHDAIFQRENPEVTKPTVSDVVERGYRIGDSILRVAKVVVDTPAGS